MVDGAFSLISVDIGADVDDVPSGLVRTSHTILYNNSILMEVK